MLCYLNSVVSKSRILSMFLQAQHEKSCQHEALIKMF